MSEQPPRLAAPAGIAPATWLLLGLLAGGCAASPPVPPPPPTTPSATPRPITEEVLAPDVIRCGVDDAPVPVGAGHAVPDRRLALVGQPLGIVAMPDPMPQRAMLPTVALSIATGEAGLAKRTLQELLHPCAEQAEHSDAGETTLAISFGSSGAPRTTRPATVGEGRGPSPFTRCLAERACKLPVTPGLAGKSSSASVRVTISPPVFTGTVEAVVALAPLDPRKKDRRSTKLVVERIEAFRQRLQDVGKTCAERLPPADEVSLPAVIEIVDGKLKPFAFQPSNDHGEVLRQCIQSQLGHELPMVLAIGKLTGVFDTSLRLVPAIPPENGEGIPVQPVR